jgi:hypothetical protein
MKKPTLQLTVGRCGPQRRFLEERFAAKAPREVEEKSYLLELIGEGELEPRMNANRRE